MGAHSGPANAWSNITDSNRIDASTKVVVQSGLVFNFDAGASTSYAGFGITCTDLSLNNNTGIFVNNPSYGSTSRGTIVFDGTNDNVSIGTNKFSSGNYPGTLSAWAKTRDRYNSRTIVSYGNAATNQARFLGIRDSNFYFSGYGSSITASGVSYDTWFNLVGVYDGTNASMYINGVLVAGPTARSWNTTSSNAGIGKNVSNTEYWKGDISQVSVYNRALSAVEIRQNYNGLRSRYASYIPDSDSWIATFGSNTSDYGRGIAVDGSGNVYITGYTASSGEGGYDAIIAKYDNSGTIQWQRTLGGTYDEYGLAIAVDGFGNVYITGTTTSSGAGSYDAFIAKYDNSGAIQWQRTLGGTGDDRGYGIAVDSSGNVYIIGYTDNSGTGSNDALIAKYDTDGLFKWQRTFGNPNVNVNLNVENGVDIAVDGSGNVYISGSTNSSGAGDYDAFIAKYNTSGTLLWQRTLGGANADVGYDIAVDSSGNVYIAGYTQSAGAGGQDVLIAKYNTDGDYQWQRSLGDTSDDQGWSIAVDGSGNVYITGYTNSSGAGSYDILIAKYDTTGAYQWQRTLGSTANDQGTGVAVDGSGNVYIIAYTAGYDIVMAKLPTDGTYTGTYGTYTYASSGLSTEISGLSTAISGISTATSGLSTATPVFISGISTFTSSVIDIP